MEPVEIKHLTGKDFLDKFKKDLADHPDHVVKITIGNLPQKEKKQK